MLKRAFNRLWNDERGNILVIGGAALPLLVGAAGLANDTIQWSLWKRQLQRAADSAAIAGVYDRVQAGNTSGTASAVNRDIQLNHHTGIALATGYPQVAFPADSSTQRQKVQVTLAVRKELSFSSMFMSQAPLIRASATAASVPGTDNYCVVSLENTTKMGIMGSGNTTVDMTCGMITNSVAANSAAAQGSAIMKATVIAASGGIQQSNNWQVGKYDPFVPAQADPFASLDVDSTERSACTASSPALSGSSGAGTTVDAGGGTRCYSSISVGSNRKLTIRNGLFLVDGGNVNIQGELVAENATIVLTNRSTAASPTIGNFDMNASGSIKMTAPTTGKWKGMAIYQDRRATDPQANQTNLSSGSPNKVNGSSAASIVGALYFPKQQLTYNGNGTADYICTQFVVRRILFSGNNTSANKFKSDGCGGAGLNPIEGGRRVRLIA